MNVDQLLIGIEGSQPRVLVSVQQYIATKICGYGNLLSSLHDLDLEILAEPEGLHKQASIARHQITELNLRALLREGNIGCKRCVCCLQFSNHHHCLISKGEFDDEF